MSWLTSAVELGVVTMDHAVPSQCSARVASERPLVLPEIPTAQQSAVSTQETLMRSLNCAFVFGLLTP